MSLFPGGQGFVIPVPGFRRFPGGLQIQRLAGAVDAPDRPVEFQQRERIGIGDETAIPLKTVPAAAGQVEQARALGILRNDVRARCLGQRRQFGVVSPDPLAADVHGAPR